MKPTIRVKVYGETYSRTVLRNNILRMLGKCKDEDFFDWYSDARKVAINIANESDLPLIVVCGVIAAISPKMNWKRNIEEARTMCLTGECKQMGFLKDKARAIINSTGTKSEILKILNGEKISAFFLNIYEPHTSENVTIDRHAIRIALGKNLTDAEIKTIPVKTYKVFENAYKAAADKYGTTPLIAQSATWVRYRKDKSLIEN